MRVLSKWFGFCATLFACAAFSVAAVGQDAKISDDAERCVSCHTKQQPGIVADWKGSRHFEVGVSCLDCHRVADEHSPMGGEHMSSGAKVSVLVPPSTCGRCHADQVEQFNASGHFRAYRQIIPKDSLHALTQVHEGRSHPEFGDAPNETRLGHDLTDYLCHRGRAARTASGAPHRRARLGILLLVWTVSFVSHRILTQSLGCQLACC